MDQKPQAGVKVFGSAVLRVEPDLASLQFAVYRRAKKPRDAFHETHQAVNPSHLRGTGESHTSSEAPSDDSGPDHALAPGSIVVGAAVSIVFAIGSPVREPVG